MFGFYYCMRILPLNLYTNNKINFSSYYNNTCCLEPAEKEDTFTSTNSELKEYIVKSLKVLPQTWNKEKLEKQILEKMSTVNDEFVLNASADILTELTSPFSDNKYNKQIDEAYNKIILMLDVENEQNGKYNKYSKYAPFYDEGLNKFRTKARSIKRRENVNGKTAKKLLCEELDAGKTRFAKDFNKEAGQNYLLEFLYKYRNTDNDTCMYFYKKFYSDTLPQATKEKCLDIAEKFNTYVFLSEPDDIDNAEYIDKELSQWRSESLGKAITPSFIYVTATMGVDSTDKAYTFKNSDFVIIKNKDYIKYALRHELTHINDTLKDSSNGIADDDLVQIRYLERKNNYIDDIDLNYKFGTYSNKNWYRDELTRSGIKDYHADYAYTSRLEYIAVASEGDYTKYSDEFKQVLIKLGMPPYMFKMIPLCRM